MSKKLAEDLNALVLDVKVGSGAFMPTYEKSKFLAELMVQTGEASGTRPPPSSPPWTSPSAASRATGSRYGSALTSCATQRHPMSADLIELSNILSGWMLHLAGHAATPEAGAKLSDEILRSGAAYKAWLKIVASQSGDIIIFEDPAAHHKPTATRTLTAQTIRLSRIDGLQTSRLGRPTPRSRPRQTRRPSQRPRRHRNARQTRGQIETNQPIVTLFSEDPTLLDEPEQMLRETLQITQTPPKLQPLIREIITKQHPA